jgi:Flp pilus assembly protein TadG
VIGDAHPDRWRDDGNALVEFTYLAVLLMVPLVYVLISGFLVQSAAFGTTEAARQAARAFIRSDSYEQGRARATAAARLALKDQGVEGGYVAIDCFGTPCPAGGSRVRITVTYHVKLPLLGSVFSDHSQGAIKVQASHVEHADRHKARE